MGLYKDAIRDDRVREYIPAVRTVMSSGLSEPDFFVGRREIQSFGPLAPADQIFVERGAYVLLDFGRELHGGIRLVTGVGGAAVGRIRIRFGESVSEAMSQPNQDHSIHDTELDCPRMGMLEYGCTGFRFVRIDILGEPMPLMNIIAVSLMRDLPRVGSFECSDPLLNKIWDTGVYTVHLNMQDYIYDGIKRDRLVWLGDLNPEIRVILAAFDDVSLIPKSLDFLRDRTPLPQYMNGIMTYSLWWVINQYDYFMHRGDMEYLKQQKDYLLGLVRHFSEMIAEDGTMDLRGNWCFLDWPTNDNKEVQLAGGRGLFAMMFKRAAFLSAILGEVEVAQLADERNQWLKKIVPDSLGYKTAAAMLTLGEIDDCTKVLTTNPTRGVSTFFGYYMLLAQPVQSALNVMRKYWGAMLDHGATSFWEDFDLDWVVNSNRIDEPPIPGKKDLHADFGKYCYLGLRHSLCHGWAGGPSACLSQKVLGINVVEPGSKRILLKPNLADLEYAKGTYPTPYGPVSVTLEAGKAPVVQAPSQVSIDLVQD